ncbi:MAG: porin family protein [Gammaproteobacteria bacterium]|nr:porin family protein [Gammaproteobacteria bacterium]
MKFIRSAKICSAALLASLLFTPAAFADSGFFIGASVGSAALSISDVNFDESDGSRKAMLGFIFDMPVVDFGIEAAYVDLGNQSDGLFDVDATAVTGFVTAGLDWGLFGAFAKAGLVSWDADVSALGLSASESGSDPAYGLGMRLTFSSIELRAEYEVLDVEDLDSFDVASVGVIWRF